VQNYVTVNFEVCKNYFPIIILHNRQEKVFLCVGRTKIPSVLERRENRIVTGIILERVRQSQNFAEIPGIINLPADK
jgi:hypothetical protein